MNPYPNLQRATYRSVQQLAVAVNQNTVQYFLIVVVHSTLLSVTRKHFFNFNSDAFRNIEYICPHGSIEICLKSIKSSTKH